MNLNKIKNYIQKINIRKKRPKKTSKLILSKVKQTSFIKKRKTFCIKDKHIEKLKILGNDSKYYYLLAFFIIISFLLYLLFGPIFKIEKIEIIKQDNITNMDISYNSINKYRGESIFSIEKIDILNNMKNYQSNIENIDINIELPNTLKIEVKSFLPIFNTNYNKQKFIIVKNGTFIPSNFSEELDELIIINKKRKRKFVDYKKILKEEYLDKMKNIIISLKENIININIKNIEYYEIERELHLTTKENTIIIFDLDGKYEAQIKKLTIFNKEYLDIFKNKLIYIDLRIKNKIFYCSIENEYKCYRNLKSIYSK